MGEGVANKMGGGGKGWGQRSNSFWLKSILAVVHQNLLSRVGIWFSLFSSKKTFKSDISMFWDDTAVLYSIL